MLRDGLCYDESMKYNNALFIGILGTACSLSLGEVVGADGLGSSDTALGNTGVYPTVVIDISGLGFYGELGNVLNDVLEIHIPGEPGSARMVALGWDLNLQTVGASWMSEAVMSFGGTDAHAFDISPFAGQDFAGSGHATSVGMIDLVNEGLNFYAGDDNNFRIEFFESFVDDPAGLDSYFLEGSTITIGYWAVIPGPGGVGAMAVGGLCMTRRRRRSYFVYRAEFLV